MDGGFISAKTDTHRCRSAGRDGRGRYLFSAALILAALLASPEAIAETDEYSSSVSDSDHADYETLRKLLGLPSRPRPAPVEAAPPPSEAVEESVPARVEQPKKPVPASRPAAASPKPPAQPPAPTRPSPAARTPRKSPVAPTPARKAPPAPARPVPGPQPVSPAPAPPPVPEEPAQVAATEDLPKAGTIVASANMERWKHLLSPSLQWAIGRGVRLEVVDTTPAPMEPSRQRATERYSAQVELSADKRSLKNYVAGIPFPHVTNDDPDLAIKTIFNFEARQVVDDLDLRGSSCDTAALTPEGVRVEKHYLSANLRRLFYVSRLHNDPKPTWTTVEGVRYREMVAGLIEPFDLKGAGYTYARYLAPERQDDSWVYYPSSRRVRRLSTAQRSEGIFGTDIDLDSFAGYSGNPAWMDWQYLGSKKVLGSMHAQNFPVQFAPPPVDFFPDDVWEVRDVHIIVGTPKLRGSGFSRRVVYIDKESLLIPYAEIYDLHGQLWKSLVFTWRHDTRPSPRAKRAVYDEVMAFHMGFSLFDMQLDHVTRCDSPSRDLPDEEGWYYNFGEAEGVTERVFTVGAVIGEAR